MSTSFDFARAPGHLIRRAQQIAVAEFTRAAVEHDVTPVQFAFMNAMTDTPGVDQITLANRVAFDAATSGSVIGRLEAKGWVRREADAQDRRRKRLWLTPEGEAVALQMKRAASQTQRRLMAPLSAAEREQLSDLLSRLVAAHEGREAVDGA